MIDILFYIFLFFVIVMLFLLFLKFRNNWVLHKRLDIIIKNVTNPKIIKQYVSYDEMFWKLWVWDIEKMRK